MPGPGGGLGGRGARDNKPFHMDRRAGFNSSSSPLRLGPFLQPGIPPPLGLRFTLLLALRVQVSLLLVPIPHGFPLLPPLCRVKIRLQVGSAFGWGFGLEMDLSLLLHFYRMRLPNRVR